MIRLLKFTLKIFITVHNMFLAGEKIKNIKSRCFVQYAAYLYEKNNIHEAINYCNRAINLNPNNYHAYWGVAAGLMEKGLFTQAIDYCNKGLTIKSDAYLIMLQSITYRALGKFDLAEEALQKIVKYCDNKIDAVYYSLVDTCYRLSLLDAAEHYSKEALAINPNEAGIHYNLAKIYSKKHQDQLAKEEFQNVLKLSSTDKKKLKRYRDYAKIEIDKIRNPK